ncbi:two-component system sensor histidine kinase RppB [Chamaesiphon sp. VAR_48_metabat_135_sub]|uniref:two-component system sensor histidine kinase RppB n=1 Tax=Chamaesiphon sp. VAR_48_metabat_135_sub TaxID=2964699 RepID=UPI00286B496A|nr:two-component system sensor histidine kinase RppB [Chamaesiphon sp. VAR_48_metabat_135_sub]
MHQNRLFNRTRIQLTVTYAIVIGLITLLSGCAIHLVMIRAFARTVDRELNTLAGTVHDSLEAVLQQPEQVPPFAMNLLPGLCVLGGGCSQPKSDSKIAELTQKQGYCLRLLTLKGKEIANLGGTKHKFNDEIPTMHWETITDDRGERYHIHTLQLKTIDNRNWGYLQVAQSFHHLDEYMNSLHLILIFGIPLAMLLISGVSWWLSGLAMQPIYQSYQQIQQFTADAAHELRTPLAVTRIAVESALDLAVIKPETRNNLEIAQRQVRHLSCLAEDLLWLSRLEAKQLPLQFQPCCLNDLVSDLEEELAPLAIANSLAEPLQKRIDLRLEILVNQPLYVNGDSDRLYRSIANLINNAIQYTPAGGIVTISLAYSDRTAIVTIKDNGIGIAPEDLPYIFDRFYRVQSDRWRSLSSGESRSTGGTGLGLAIARAIVQAHHGNIQVDSQLDRGSTFTVSLPIKATPSKISSQNKTT